MKTMNTIEQAPELGWLKANSVNATPEGVNTNNIEYKRTLCSIKLLNYVLEGNYEAFSKCQKTGRITLESFNELREYVKSALQTPEDDKNDNIKVTKKGNIKTTNIGYFF